jgi:L-asparaginase
VVLETPRPAPLASAFHGRLAAAAELPNIGIAYLRAGCGDAPVRAWRESGCEGLVVAGFGAGTMPRELAETVRELAREGCIVVVSSRVGEVAVQAETMTLRGSGGLLASGFLNPQKSVVLLSLALAAGLERTEIGHLFDRFSAAAARFAG